MPNTIVHVAQVAVWEELIESSSRADISSRTTGAKTLPQRWWTGSPTSTDPPVGQSPERKAPPQGAFLIERRRRFAPFLRRVC